MTLKDVGDLFEDLGNKTNVAGNIANIRNANDTAKIRQLLEEQADPRLREARLAREARELEKTLERERIERVFKEVRSQYLEKFGLEITKTVGGLTLLILLAMLLAIPVLIGLFYGLVGSFPLVLLYCSFALLYCWRTGKSKKEVYLLPLRLCRKVCSPIIDRLGSRSIKNPIIDDDYLTRYEQFLSRTKIAVVSQSPFLEMDAKALVKHVGNGDIKIGDSFKYSMEPGIPARTLTKEIIERAEQEIR